jgi:Flp pilus assembly protein TadG
MSHFNKSHGSVIMLQKRTLSSQKGVQAIEFALILPVLIILLFGVFEFGRYIIALQKANKLAHTVSNLAAQQTHINCGNLQEIFSDRVTANILNPFDFKMGNGDGIMISAVNNTGGNQRIVFQARVGTQGPDVPVIGAQGGAANFAALPGGYTLQQDEGVIVVEVTYRYDPILLPAGFIESITGPVVTWHYGLWRPRGGAQVRLDPPTLTTCP